MGGASLVPLATLVSPHFLLLHAGTTAGVEPSIVLFGAASLLFLLGGLDPGPGAFKRCRFTGPGVVTLGGSIVFSWMDRVANGGPTVASLSVVLVGAVTTFVLGFVEVDWFLGGRHFDLSVFEPGSILDRRTDAGEK